MAISCYSQIYQRKNKKKNWFTDLFESVKPASKVTVKVGDYTYTRDFDQDAVTVDDIFEAETETIDTGRDNYVKRFTDLSRYDMRNYDLILDMDFLTEDEAVEMILAFIGR